jgi:hypothetical protein
VYFLWFTSPDATLKDNYGHHRICILAKETNRTNKLERLALYGPQNRSMNNNNILFTSIKIHSDLIGSNMFTNFSFSMRMFTNFSFFTRMSKGTLVHVASACTGFGEGFNHFGSHVRNLSAVFLQ